MPLFLLRATARLLIQSMRIIMTLCDPMRNYRAFAAFRCIASRRSIERRSLDRNGMGTVISFDSERRRRGAKRPFGPRSPLRSSDPVTVAIRLCRELETLNGGQDRWVLVKTLCKQTNLPRQLVVGAAVYAHVRGWLICTPFSLLLREEGRALLSCSPIDEYRTLPLKADFLLDAISQAGD